MEISKGVVKHVIGESSRKYIKMLGMKQKKALLRERMKELMSTRHLNINERKDMPLYQEDLTLCMYISGMSSTSITSFITSACMWVNFNSVDSRL